MISIYKSGPFRAYRISYPSGEGAVIWRPDSPGHEMSGPCFDVSVEELPDLAELVSILRGVDSDPVEYQPSLFQAEEETGSDSPSDRP